MKKLLYGLTPALVLTLAVFGQTSPQLTRLIEIEALTGNVMNYAETLIDSSGSRLSLSGGLENAQELVVKTLSKLGLKTQLKQYAPFGRSWENRKLTVSMVKPYYQALVTVAVPWTGSTNGVVRVEVVKLGMPASNAKEFPAVQAKFINTTTTDFGGKIVLMEDPGTALESLEPPKQYTEAELAGFSRKPAACATVNFATVPIPDVPPTAAQPCYFDQAGLKLLPTINNRDRVRRMALRIFLKQRGAIALASAGRAQTGTFLPSQGDMLRAGEEAPPPTISLSPEDNALLFRLLSAGTRVELEMEVGSFISADEPTPSNVIAEITGNTKPNEVVMAGAHLDSMPFSSGATDNAGNCAVLMEVARIFTAANFHPDRTIRFVFWNGEEQGMMGSQGYIAGLSTEERNSIVAYFNADKGGGKIRGVTIHPKDPPETQLLLKKWLSPLALLGTETVGYSYFDPSDHRPFQEAGIPAADFLQDPEDYAKTRHSNRDTLERLRKPNLVQEVVVVANILATAANSPETLPRRTQ